MIAEHDEPSETSPLLAKPADAAAASGVGVDGVQVIGDAASVRVTGTVEAGDDEERQGGNGAGPQQYQGMPEVKKQLKYILPAIAIGVRRKSVRNVKQWADCSVDFPFCWRPDYHCVELWQDR